jgi:hypothetical protein
MLYVLCLCILTSPRIPQYDPGRQTPYFLGCSVTVGTIAILGLDTHSKHLEIAAMLTARMLSPYKDYSSFLRW